METRFWTLDADGHVGIVDEAAGGIIAYATDYVHANMIVAALTEMYSVVA